MQGPSQATQEADSRETDEEQPEHNGMSPEDVSSPEEGADEPEILPESWEAMAGDAAGHRLAHESAGGVAPQNPRDTICNVFGKSALCTTDLLLS